MKSIKIIFLFLFAALLSAQQGRFIESFTPKLILDSMDFPEGPAYNGKSLFVSSCYSGFIKKISGAKDEVFIKADTNGIKQTNGLTFFKDGSLYACDYGKGAILKISKHGEVKVVVSGYEGKRFNRPNDLAFDEKGNLYFTDPKTSDTLNPDGRVFVIDSKTNKVDLLLDGIAYPNGIAFLKHKKEVYICESAKNRVLKFDVTEDKKFINKRVFVTLPGGSPDGIAFDQKSNLYIAHFGGGAIYVVSPKGEIKEKYNTPGKKASNLEFAGSDRKDLYFTEDETNSVYLVRVKIPGMPLLSSPVK